MVPGGEATSTAAARGHGTRIKPHRAKQTRARKTSVPCSPPGNIWRSATIKKKKKKKEEEEKEEKEEEEEKKEVGVGCNLARPSPGRSHCHHFIINPSSSLSSFTLA